ncbi:MAG: glycosyltransferase [Polyangiaceae bacterium]
MKICFFAKVRDREILRYNEFYANDIRCLRELGHDVRLATHPRELGPADAYFVWWWTWAWAPVAVAKTLRRPVVVTGVFDYDDYPQRPPAHRVLMDLALRYADANIFLSKLERELVPSRIRTRNPLYSPCVIDTDIYSPAEAPREKFVLTIAWMNNGNSRRKCIPEVIQVAARLHACFPDYRFVIAGEKGSDYHEVLAPLVQRLGAADYIEFPGVVSREQKVNLLQRCSLYLQPSRFEGFGVGNLEALACGAPTLTSPVGAVPEVVGDAAELVSGIDVELLSEAARGLIEDESKRAALSTRGRERAVREFSFERRKRDLEAALAGASG